MDIILTCILRATAYKGHILWFLSVAFIYRFDCIYFYDIWRQFYFQKISSPEKLYCCSLSFPSLVLYVAFFNQFFFPFSFPTFALFILQLAVSENLNGILKNSYLQGLKTNEDTKVVITNHKSKKDRQFNNQKDKQT